MSRPPKFWSSCFYVRCISLICVCCSNSPSNFLRCRYPLEPPVWLNCPKHFRTTKENQSQILHFKYLLGLTFSTSSGIRYRVTQIWMELDFRFIILYVSNLNDTYSNISFFKKLLCDWDKIILYVLCESHSHFVRE